MGGFVCSDIYGGVCRTREVFQPRAWAAEFAVVDLHVWPHREEHMRRLQQEAGGCRRLDATVRA